MRYADVCLLWLSLAADDGATAAQYARRSGAPHLNSAAASRLQRLLQPSKQEPGSCTTAAPCVKPAAEAHSTAAGAGAAAHDSAQRREDSERAFVDSARLPGSLPSSVPQHRQTQQQQTSSLERFNAGSRVSVPIGSSAAPGALPSRPPWAAAAADGGDKGLQSPPQRALHFALLLLLPCILAAAPMLMPATR